MRKEQKTLRQALGTLAITAMLFISAFGVNVSHAAGVYQNRFMEMWQKINNPTNGYISKEGIPYHSVEKLIIEAVEYGHRSTSEAISEKLWLDAVYAYYTRDWSYFKNDWDVMEKYFIPTPEEQPNINSYTPNNPAGFCPEFEDPAKYPVPVNSSAPNGLDPIYNELKAKHGVYPYLMAWNLDVDNWLGFNNPFNPEGRVSKSKLFERGPNESTWETIPHAAYDAAPQGPNSYYDIFVQTTAPQWRYTSAPDAELRVIQVMYVAEQFAKAQGVDLSEYVAKAAKMGDWMRYCLFSKYFRAVGKYQTAGTGYDSAHYLVSWYAGWGGGIGSQTWAWKIGSHSAHIGYQNPISAMYLTNLGIKDWDKSLDRQLEMAEFCQLNNGIFAGGVANHVSGETAFPTTKPGPFHGMDFDVNPVYLDPGSSTWSGWQFWFVERLVQYYLSSGEERAYKLINKWMGWIKPLIRLTAEGDVEIPVGLDWAVNGVLQDKIGAKPIAVTNVQQQVTVVIPADSYGRDIGLLGSLVKILVLWDQATLKYKTQDPDARIIAKEILDRVWVKYSDSKGIAPIEARGDYSRFWDQTIPMPAGMSKTLPWGATITSTSKYYQSRPDYGEPLPPKGPYNDANPAPVYTYHRTWQQSEIATAYAYYDMYIEKDNTSSSSSTTTSSSKSSSSIKSSSSSSIIISSSSKLSSRISSTVSSLRSSSSVAVSSAASSTSSVFNGTLKVQTYQNGSPSQNQIYVRINLVNAGTSPIALSTVKVRYYLKYQGTTSYNFMCDYSSAGSGNVTGVIAALNPAAASADAYNEISFASGAGSIAPGGTVEIQGRMWKSDWSNIDNTLNYSYNPATSYTDWNKVTATVNGTLVWGIAPNGSSSSSSKVSSVSSAVVSSKSSTVSSIISSSRSSVASSSSKAVSSSSSVSSAVSSSSSSSSTGVVYTTITAPFTFDGAGTHHWKIAVIPNYVNSWNLSSLSINGTSFLNLYVGLSQLPAKQDGYYYIDFTGPYNWSHIEIK